MKKFEESYNSVYAGYIKENNILIECTSGGIASALAATFIESGGYVVGVEYTEDFYDARYIITNKMGDLKRIRGTKYISAKINNIFYDVRMVLEKGNKVLFFGLPCVIAALIKSLEKYYDKLYTCELICHGPIANSVHVSFIKELEKKYNSKIVGFSVRSKKRKWQPPYLKAIFENGKKFEKNFYRTDYGIAFSISGRNSCYSCKYKGINHKADIMIGDYWGINKKDRFWNKLGVSVIFVKNNKGEECLKSAGKVVLFETTFDKALAKNPMVLKSKEKSEFKESFDFLFKENGISYAIRHCMNYRSRLRLLVRLYFPKSIIKFLRKVLKR